MSIRRSRILVGIAILGIASASWYFLQGSDQNSAAKELLSVIQRRDWNHLYLLELEREKQLQGWSSGEFSCLLDKMAGGEDSISGLLVTSLEEVSTGTYRVSISTNEEVPVNWSVLAHRGPNGYRYEIATLPLFINKMGGRSKERLLRLAEGMESCGVKSIVGRAGSNELTTQSLRDVGNGRAAENSLWQPRR